MDTWPATPDEALRFLLDGNERFVSGGAVGAALEAHASGVTPPGHFRHIVERLTPEILEARQREVTDPNEIIRMHGRHTARALVDSSTLVRERVDAGECGVVVLAYQLVDGR